MKRFFTGGAVAALALAAAAGAASAQDYDRLVVLGDSLSDNGNLYQLTHGGKPASPPYYQGRFSSGPTFVELLGFDLQRYDGDVRGDINLAFGGALTDATLPDLALGNVPGMKTQLGGYLMAGGTFGAGDLVSVLGGANNIFGSLSAYAALPAGVREATSPAGFVQPTLVGAANDINAIVGAVAGAGAGTVLVTNLPRLGVTPQFSQGPGAALGPLADYAGQTFNSLLLSGLKTTAAAQPGSNIILMDLYRVSEVLRANPGEFGLSNVTDSCFNESALSVCSNPDGYLYWDGVHPTAAGHRLIARLATDYLYYGDIGAQTALQGETAYRHRETALDAASEALSGREAWTAGAAVTASAWGDSVDTDARGVVSKSSSDGWGARIALEAGPSEAWRFGLAGTAANADVQSPNLSFTVESFGLDLYGGWRSGGAFVNAAVGVARDNIDDIERITSLAPIVHTAETRALSTGARLQAGTWFDMGGFALSPRAAVTWASSDVDGYYETGAAAQYEYGDRVVEALTGEVVLRAEAAMGGFNLFAEGGYRDALDDRSDAVRVGIHDNPAQVLAREVEEPFGGQVLASAGVEGDVGPVKVTIGYRGRFGDHADSHMGAIQLHLPL